MKLETKRIFISNLPKNVSDSDLKEKFSEYGRVSTVEIKQRKEVELKTHLPCFAFVNLDVDNVGLQRCFENFAKEKWKGDYIELQIAKESFLSRLKKEREEAVTVNSKNPTSKYGVTNGSYDNSSSIVGTSRDSPDIKSKNVTPDVISAINMLKNNSSNSIKEKLKIEPVLGNEPIIKVERTKGKSLDPKRAEANLKRIQSLIEMKKGYQQQKLLIRNALSKVDIKLEKKIIFDDDENTTEPRRPSDSINDKTTWHDVHATKANLLFEDEDGNDDDVEYNFDVKEQFHGRKGLKLLELQSRYKQDDRFALDARFLEDELRTDETQGDDDIPREADNIDESSEKQQQLSILETVLGRAVTARNNDSENNPKRNRKVMLRFDPTQPDHSKYEVKVKEFPDASQKKNRKKTETKEKDENKPIVSKEKFYEVTGDMKDVLNSKETFSLLSIFEKVPGNDLSGANEEKIEKMPTKHKVTEKNPFKYDSSDDESGSDRDSKILNIIHKNPEINKQNVNLGPTRLWAEPLFFRNNDSRFQEGIDFIKKFQTEETLEFSRVRRDLTEIVRAKVKNNQRRNKPFKKKLGGRKKMTKGKKAMKR